MKNKLKQIFVVLLFVVISVVPICSQSQKVYSIDKYAKLYRAIETLQLESGISPISSTYPYTQKEIEYILTKVNSSSDLYNWVLSQLIIGSDEVGFKTYNSTEINVETYIQTNTDNDFWVYDYNQRKPVVNFDLAAGINKYFWADISLPIQKGLTFSDYDTGAESNVTLLWNLDQIDLQFPFLALSSLGGDNWSVILGRDILNYGVGKSGTFAISDAGSFHDFFRMSTFWDKFKYSMTLLNIEAIDVDGLDTYKEYTEVLINTDGDTTSVLTADRRKLKVLIDHAFEFRPFNNLSIALHEVNIRGGGELTLGFFNPLMIMHNLTLTDKSDTVYGNSITTVSMVYTPIKKLKLYGEYVLDQFETPSEAQRQDEVGSGEPNAFGYLIGADYYMNLKKYSLLFNIEYVLTNPHLYRSDNSWSIYALTRLYHNIYNDSNDIQIEPLGYEYGPDVQLLQFLVSGTFLKNKLDISLKYMNILKGESNLEDRAEEGTIAFDKTTPSGDVVFKRNIITMDVSYNINSNLSVYGQFNGLFFKNFDNVSGDDFIDFQIILGSSFKF